MDVPSNLRPAVAPPRQTLRVEQLNPQDGDVHPLGIGCLACEPRAKGSGGSAAAAPVVTLVQWELEAFSQLPDLVESPTFECLGQQWRLLALPRGSDQRGRSLGLYLEASGASAQTPFSGWRQPLAFALAVVDQAPGSTATRVRWERHVFSPAERQYGFTAFMRTAQLRGAEPASGGPGSGSAAYLVADRLVVAARLAPERERRPPSLFRCCLVPAVAPWCGGGGEEARPLVTAGAVRSDSDPRPGGSAGGGCFGRR